jgi:hypothetical protein
MIEVTKITQIGNKNKSFSIYVVFVFPCVIWGRPAPGRLFLGRLSGGDRLIRFSTDGRGKNESVYFVFHSACTTFAPDFL